MIFSKQNYTVEIEILGEKWKKSGETIEEAFKKIPLTWHTLKGKGTIIVSHGTQKYVHLVNRAVLSRIFSNKIARASMAKNLGFLLKNDVKTNIPERLEINKE